MPSLHIHMCLFSDFSIWYQNFAFSTMALQHFFISGETAFCSQTSVLALGRPLVQNGTLFEVLTYGLFSKLSLIYHINIIIYMCQFPRLGRECQHLCHQFLVTGDQYQLQSLELECQGQTEREMGGGWQLTKLSFATDKKEILSPPSCFYEKI